MLAQMTLNIRVTRSCSDVFVVLVVTRIRFLHLNGTGLAFSGWWVVLKLAMFDVLVAKDLGARFHVDFFGRQRRQCMRQLSRFVIFAYLL